MRRPQLTMFQVAQVLAASVALVRISRGADRYPRIDPGRLEGEAPAGTGVGPEVGAGQPGAGSASAPPVTVVIPARNEVDRLGPCLEALVGQNCEVIVVDDQSDDGTAALAARLRARVIAGSAPPPGWVGKSWALQQGMEAASNNWIITLDADTRPGPRLVKAVLDAAVDWDLLSIGARFICDSPGQQFLHPAMLATLVYRFGPPGAKRSPRASRAIANGQCLVFERDWLIERGGFAAVADRMTDDVALVRHLAAAGARVGFLDGGGVLDVEMYRSGAEVWREWGRSLSMADVTSPINQAADLAVVWLAQALPLIRLIARRATPVDAALVAVRIALLGATRPSYRSPKLAYWLSPLADVAAAARLTQTTLKPVRTWRGRTYAN